MECNKEDAIKGVQLAERKMQNNDFTGARKLAQKAQQLFPVLENISQLLVVCEVHCSSENKLGGCEMDWYGILHIERFSYEPTIKKQYRKLGLLLHRDKDKFAGAEAVFKLIGEANAVLVDRGKHFLIYAMRCRALLRTGATQSSAHQFNPNLFVRKHYDAASHVQSIPQSQCTSINQHQQFRVERETYISRWKCSLESSVKAGNAAVDGASNTEKKDNDHGVGVGKEAVTLSKSVPVMSKDSGPQNSVSTQLPTAQTNIQYQTHSN
ncbi:hypothetical protein M0R45_018277 [Rubus argutus]|uniref:J domain-containing protein n=1 Tax=Rubus argutus TaxID=59490 RepID=A0AAW1X5H2_RUBAR